MRHHWFYSALIGLLFLSPTFARGQDHPAQWDDEPNEISWEHFAGSRFAFADFADWWSKLPAQRRQSALDAAKNAGMLAPQPAQYPSVLIQGEAFKGDRWSAANVDGRAVLEGPAGHGGPTASLVVNVPQAGTYRLWARWWNLPGYHNSFELRIRPGSTKDYHYSWQATAQGDYLDHRFAFAWFMRRDRSPEYQKRPVTYQADKKGFQWESAPLVKLPKGPVVIEFSPTVHQGPYTGRRIDCFLLTQDPLLVPGDQDIPDGRAGDAASMIVDQQKSPTANQTTWRTWCIRPGAMPPAAAPKPVAAIWHEWHDELINRLAKGQTHNVHEKELTYEVYFDRNWNLIGTPAMVAAEAAELQSPGTRVNGFFKWIEAETFTSAKGWTPADDTTAGGGKALQASYSNGPAEASITVQAPHEGAYRLWVRASRIRGHYSTFEVAVRQGNQLVHEEKYHDLPPKDAPGGYSYAWLPIELPLKAGPCQIVLSKNLGKSPYAYRKIDCVALTDDLNWKPRGLQHPVPAGVPEDRPKLVEAAKAARAVAWLADPQDQWTGFTMTDWPTSAKQIVGASPVPIDVQPGAVASRVLHLTNPSGRPITLTPSVTAEGTLLNWRVVAWQFHPKYGWQPMPLLRRHSVTIPPHLSAALWLDFDARTLPPGTQSAALDLGAQKIQFQVNVGGTDLRQAPVPLVGGFCHPFSLPDGWRTFADIGLNVEHGPMISKEQMRQYGIRLIVLSLGAPKSPEQVHDVVKTVQSLGLDYSDWTWRISDEPNKRTYPKWVAAAKAIRQADPKIRIWCNPGEIEGSTPEAVTAMSPWIDVFCPYINQFTRAPDAAYKKLVTNLGSSKLLYTTPCAREKSPAAPLELLALAKMALDNGRDGWDCFTLCGYYSATASAWDEVNAPFGAQAVSIYPGAHRQVIGSRNLEAVRQAIQDWKAGRLAGNAQ
jgi:hypothetical protein